LKYCGLFSSSALSVLGWTCWPTQSPNKPMSLQANERHRVVPPPVSVSHRHIRIDHRVAQRRTRISLTHRLAPTNQASRSPRGRHWQAQLATIGRQRNVDPVQCGNLFLKVCSPDRRLDHIEPQIAAVALVFHTAQTDHTHIVKEAIGQTLKLV